MKITVYSSITLGPDDVRTALGRARLAPPVERDDLLRDIDAGVNVVIIVDGKFHHARAVSPGEILDALRCGLRVYGTSSMGALRAAELHPFGMVGHGAIYEHVRTSPAFRDDDLGQAVVETPHGLRAVSEPYIDFYFKMRRLLDAGRVTPGDFVRICRACRTLHYAERTWRNVQAALRRTAPGRPALPRIVAVTARMASQKRRDALSTLRLVRGGLRRIAGTRL